MAVVASIIDNDGMLYTDQIVGGVGEEGLPVTGAGPARRRIGWGDEPVYRAQQAIGRNMLLQRELLEHRSLFDLPMTHHDRQSRL